MWHVGLVSTRPVSPPRIILRRARRIVPDTEVVGKPTRDPAVRGNTHPHMHHHSLTTSIYMILMHRWRDLPIRLLFRLVAHWWLSGVVVIASASLRVHHGQDRPHPHARHHRQPPLIFTTVTRCQSALPTGSLLWSLQSFK
jgi:hypothetical protein